MEKLTNKEDDKPRVVLLYRASTKKQTDSQNDIPLQRNILRPWADEQGKFIREFVEGGISGYKVSAAKRDAILEIKAMADRREFDILGIFMSDRLGRIADDTPPIVSYLNLRGVKVISFCEGEISAKTHTDKLLTYIRYWQAEAESIKNSERITHAIEVIVKQGKWRGGCPPYGYKSISIGTLNFKGRPIFDVVIDPETSEIVKEIFKLYKEHYGVKGIAKYLNDRKILTKNGGVWRKSQILNILKNKLYIGIYELGKRSKVRLESPIMEHLSFLSEQDFYEVQELLKNNSDNASQRPTIRGSRMLNGLLFCECGRKYTSQIHSKKKQRQNGTIWTYHRATYRCDSFRQPKVVQCNKKPFAAEMLEKLIIDDVKKLITELMIRKRMHRELENWLAHFDAQNIMKKKAILIDIIDKIVIKEDNIDIIYKIAKPPATLNGLLVAQWDTRPRPSSNLYKPLIIKITRKIPLNIKKTLVNMDKTENVAVKQLLLEYCKEPRTVDEIKKFIKLDSTRDSVRRHFINPLLREKKLKYVQSYMRHANQRYINAEVEITPDMLVDIRRMNDTVQKREQMLLEFCKVPRSIREIKKHIETTSAMVYLRTLMNDGKIKYTMPHIPSYKNQKYINAEIEYESLSEESVIEFCKTPRTKKEILEHFNMSLSIRRAMIRNLIENGKLIYTEESLELHEFDGNRRLTSSLDLTAHVRVPATKKKPREFKNLKTRNNKTGFTAEQELLEYCKEPRTMHELREFLNVKSNSTANDRFIKPLREQGKIKYLYPESPSSNYQRYVISEIEFTPEKYAELEQERKTEQDIELEQKTLAFCKEPKTSGEIMKHLGLGDYASVKRVIRPLMNQGKIKFKYSHDPHYNNQEYVISEWEHFPIPFTEENVIEFCKTPRQKCEIYKHFQIGEQLCNNYIKMLVDKGRLSYTKSFKVDNKIIQRMLISNG